MKELLEVPRKASNKKFKNTGVRLEEPVMTFLDALAVEEERHRSFLINRIVREYAQQKGRPIPVELEAERKRA